MSRVGETIAGKYRIIAPIGAGGMGTVYAARHVQLDTPLALKFLSDNAKGSVERFLREAKACAALKSEHVCRVSDYGIDGETPYIAMELLDGEDLASVLRGGKLTIPTAVDYVIQACIGIAEAHSLGIVHRDLKPGNLFLTKRPDGSPLIKVLDFGVAKVPIFNNVSLTQNASVDVGGVGTVGGSYRVTRSWIGSGGASGGRAGADTAVGCCWGGGCG